MDVSYIYALVDPNNHTVRYVGQTKALHVRYLGHINAASQNGMPVYGWIRGIAPAKPILVLLETIPHDRQLEVRPGITRKLSSIIEGKWLKRFRRTILNVNKQQCGLAFDDFVNPPELNPEYSTED